MCLLSVDFDWQCVDSTNCVDHMFLLGLWRVRIDLTRRRSPFVTAEQNNADKETQKGKCCADCNCINQLIVVFVSEVRILDQQIG